MRKIMFLCFIVIVITTALPLYAQRGSAQAQTLEVRLASPLPKESPWGRTLDRIASEWQRVTGGQVRLRILHGGTEGGEERMLLSLNSNNIQAAIFTSIGLSIINPAVITVSAPFLIRNDTELNAVFNEIQGDLERTINSGNYFMLAWSKAGYVNIFSKDPVLTPDDLKRHRLASSPDSADINNAFKAMGFSVVETDWNDIGPKMNAGAVTATYLNPPAVAAFLLHTVLRNMLDINIAPVIGGIVVNQVTWRRIGTLNPRYQQELMRVTRQVAGEFDASLQRTVDDSLRSMTRAGLKVNSATAAHERAWQNEVERALPQLLTNVYDRALYNRINEILIRHRGRR